MAPGRKLHFEQLILDSLIISKYYFSGDWKLTEGIKKKCFNFKKDKFVTFLKVLGNFVITIVRGYMYIYITFMDVLWHISCSKGARVTQWSYEPCNAWLLKTGHSEEFWQIMIQRSSKWQPTPAFFLWEALNSMKMQKDMTLEVGSSRSEGVQ